MIDGFFFVASKLFWAFFNPGNLLLTGLGVGVFLLWGRHFRWGRRLLAALFCLSLFVAVVPLGRAGIQNLEDRFPQPASLPERIDGIIVLGGVVSQYTTRARGQVSVGGSVERITEAVALSRRFPKAKFVYSGGSGYLFKQDVKEADVLGPFLDLLGIDRQRMIVENQSRNTHENAAFTKAMLKPGPAANWILVTSAFHMPRAVGSFRQAGWASITPYPVDYITAGDNTWELGFSLQSGLSGLNTLMHEWLGLVFYRLGGYTDALYPGPAN